jgi:maleate cis-trans isomerase
MARIPLNKFRRYSQPLTPTPTPLYTVPFDRAGIILIALGTNVTPNMQTVTISVSTTVSENGTNYIDIIKNVEIGAYDAAHLTIGKLVLTDGDSIFASCSNLSAVNLTLSLLEAVNT